MSMTSPVQALGSPGRREVYSQVADPGAVGAGVIWIDISASPALIYVRNATNTGWDGTRAGAPLNAEYWVETVHADLANEVVVGTTGITTAAYAARQAAAMAGRLFFPNDGFYVERDTGATWMPWGPIFPLIAPKSGDFSWINQGATTISTTNGGVHMSITGTGGDNNRLRVKVAPGTPYTITAAFLPNWRDETTWFGLVHRESASGKFIGYVFQVIATVAQLRIAKWTNPTTFSAAYATEIVIEPSPFFIRIEDDGTNRKFYISRDGQNFVLLHSIGRTDFCTPDQVGWAGHVTTLNSVFGVTLMHWQEN